MDKPATPAKRTTQQVMHMPLRRGGWRPGGGRPVKLDAELLGAIVDGLQRGLSVPEVAERCAINPWSFYNWRAKGRLQPDSIYGELVRRTDVIRAEQHAAEQQRLEEQRRKAPPKLPGVKRTRRDPQTLLVARVFELVERSQRQQQRATAKAQGADTETTADAPPHEMTEAEKVAAEYARLRALLDARQEQTQNFLANLATHHAALADIHQHLWGDGSYGSANYASDDEQHPVTRKRRSKGTP